MPYTEDDVKASLIIQEEKKIIKLTWWHGENELDALESRDE